MVFLVRGIKATFDLQHEWTREKQNPFLTKAGLLARVQSGLCVPLLGELEYIETPILEP